MSSTFSKFKKSVKQGTESTTGKAGILVGAATVLFVAYKYAKGKIEDLRRDELNKMGRKFAKGVKKDEEG